jgi:hypothetical protein
LNFEPCHLKQIPPSILGVNSPNKLPSHELELHMPDDLSGRIIKTPIFHEGCARDRSQNKKVTSPKPV